MRKILSREVREKKDKRNKTILGVILVIIMVFSTIGYAFYSSDKEGEGGLEVITYRSIDFIPTEYGKYRFQIGENTYETYYHPEQTSNITGILTKTLEMYKNKPLYFGVDSREEINQQGSQEIVYNIGRFLERQGFSCLTEDCEEDYALKSCVDSNIIIFKQSNLTRITEDIRCVYIEYKEGEVERASDALLFRLLGLQ